MNMLKPIITACLCLGLGLGLGLGAAGTAWADPAPFDLTGPMVQVTVKRGGVTLPIAQTPDLATGDQLTIRAKLPADQSAHYLLVAVFLRGATNPPPKEWFFQAETWKRKDKDNMLRITVPEGARQAVLFLAPETGGDFDALLTAIRGRPGEFVRAAQDLNQASLDRSRLDAFLEGIRVQDTAQPERLEAMSPILARSLAIKLNTECLDKEADLQAACLSQGREALLLNDVHSSSITETLTGAPADLALQLSATPQAGLGYYSPYIGAVRDLARIFGAFRTAQYQYIPALAINRDDTVALLLNAAPSFRKPQSVLVTALPAIETPHPPPLRATPNSAAVCATMPELLLPVEGAPLIYSTRYAHDMKLRLKTKDGRMIDLPVTARADKGGYVIDGAGIQPADFGDTIDASLHGLWGFQPFEGPRFILQNVRTQGWRTAGDRKPSSAAAPVQLEGASAACVERVSLSNAQGKEQALVAKATGPQTLRVELPATVGAEPMTLQIKQYGAPEAIAVPLTAEAAPKRPVATLLTKSVQPMPAATALAIGLSDGDALPSDARLSFSIKAGADTRFSGQDVVEVSTTDGVATTMLTMTNGLKLESSQIAHGTLVAGKDLGASAFGKLQFRLVQAGVTGDWQPLATLVRLPALQGLACDAADKPCALSGNSLFLIDSVADNAAFNGAQDVPQGFTGANLPAPHPKDGKLYLKLRDNPQAINTVTIPAKTP
ncbi:hypothetical protein BH10PSE12_BH10PSE12_28950 [soil metagenome]